MNPERHVFLTLRQSPARLNAEEAAWILGFSPHEIPMLIAARLLKPLGNPAHNGCKYFSADQLQQLRADSAWLNKASDAIMKYWKAKNSRKSTNTTRSNGLHRRRLIE
jgi:hypothetical protein